jgi:ribosomal protein S27E
MANTTTGARRLPFSRPMPSITTHCPACATMLTVPEGGESRRLRCPKCSTRFFADGRPASGVGMPASDLAHRPSSTIIPQAPARGSGDADMPTLSGDTLREVFDPSLLDENEAPTAARVSRGVGPAGTPPPPATAQGTAKPAAPKPAAPKPPAVPDVADVAGLFADEPPKKRPTQAAEARFQPRECPDCGHLVPAGMSLCTDCGLDLDSGQKVDLEDFAEDIPEPMVRATTPFPVVLIGTFTMLAAAVSLIVGLVALEGLGRISVAILCAFAMYGGYQFLRGKSTKPLITALILAGLLDVIGLIAMPIIRESVSITPEIRYNELGEEVSILPRLEDRIDRRAITWGIILLLIDAGLVFFLSTTTFQVYYDNDEEDAPLPL